MSSKCFVVLIIFVTIVVENVKCDCNFERGHVKNLVEDAENVYSHVKYVDFGEDIDLKEFQHRCDPTGIECFILFKVVEVVYYYDRTYIEHYRMDGNNRITVNGSYSFMHTAAMNFTRGDTGFNFQWENGQNLSVPIDSIDEMNMGRIPKDAWNSFSDREIEGSISQDEVVVIDVNDFYQKMIQEIANVRRGAFEFAEIADKLVGHKRNISFELGDFFQFATYAFYGDDNDYLRMWVWRTADKLDGSYFCGSKVQKYVVRDGMFELWGLSDANEEIDEPVTIKPPLDILRDAANHPFILKLKQGEIPVRPIVFY